MSSKKATKIVIPWQDLGSEKKGKHLLSSGLMSDCTFLVGEGQHAKRFDCHKLILIMASPVFETMFCGNFQEASTTNPIPIPDTQPGVFRLFLEFIYDPRQISFKNFHDDSDSDYSDEEGYGYTESADVRNEELNENFENYTFDTLKDLLYLGNKYMIKSLGRQCCLALNQQLRMGNEEAILRIFELAVTTDHKGLAAKSARHFERDYSLVSTQLIYDLDASIICELLKYLKLTPSKEVLETIHIYIGRNSLCVKADNEDAEWALCQNCEQPYKRNINYSFNSQEGQSASQLESHKTNDSNYNKNENNKRTLKNNQSCQHYQKRAKINDPSTSKPSIDNGERNLQIIKELYESVNFNDMTPHEFFRAAKEPGLAQFLSFRRKFEIAEKLWKNFLNKQNPSRSSGFSQRRS